MEFIKQIIDVKYDSVAMYLNTENLYNALKLVDFIKIINPACKLIGYGDMPLYLPNFFKDKKIDAIVKKNTDQEVAILDYFKYASSKNK